MSNNATVNASSQKPAPQGSDLSAIIAAAKAQSSGDGLPPVHLWEPEFCGQMDMVIKSDGSWWHDGTPIGREKLVQLFSTILRKDEDGQHYLVTPVEKIAIEVERAAFIATKLDVTGRGDEQKQNVFFTTNLAGIVALDADHPVRVDIEPQTDRPLPFLAVRGRLEALLTRPVFFELAELATERETPDGPQLGIWSAGQFFPLGASNSHI